MILQLHSSFQIINRLTSSSDDGGDDGPEAVLGDDYWPACTDRYTDLDTLQSKKNSISANCIHQYIADVQVATMENAINKYNDLMKNGYDHKFDIYSGYMKDQLPEQMATYMGDNRIDKYFKCKETKSVTCCNDCSGWQGCPPGCSKDPGCKSGQNTFVDMKECPKLTSQQDFLSSVPVSNATWTMTDSDGFYKDIANVYGIDKSWIVIGDRDMKLKNGCQFAGADVLKCQRETGDWYWNYPGVDVNKANIFNPKDVVQKALPNADTMCRQFEIMAMFGQYDFQINAAEIVDATALPAFSVD